MSVEVLSISAPAKVNLFFKALGRLSTGYHLVNSLILPINFADKITIEICDFGSLGTELGIDLETIFSPELSAHMDCISSLNPTFDSEVKKISTKENIAIKAVKGFVEKSGVKADFRIRLVKEVPFGAGLGGGSSDAAAILRNLCQRFDFDFLSKDWMELALGVGSDVCAQLYESPVFVSGVGEQIIPLGIEEQARDAYKNAGLVILKPPLHISTALAYGYLKLPTLDEDQLIEEKPYFENCRTAKYHPLKRESFGVNNPLTLLNKDVSRLGSKSTACEIFDELNLQFKDQLNDFLPVISKRFEQLDQAKEIFKKEGVIRNFLTGSGSALIGITETRDQADIVSEKLRSDESIKGWFVKSARFVC